MLQSSKITDTFIVKIKTEITFDDQLTSKNWARDNVTFALKRALQQVLTNNQLEAEIRIFKEV